MLAAGLLMDKGANDTLVVLWVDAPSVVKVEAAELDKALLRVDVSVIGAGFNCVGFNVPRPWRRGATLTSSSYSTS